jgi:hypothetical protein
MPPKDSKKTASSKDGKIPPKPATKAAKKASDDTSGAADGAVKDTTATKPITPIKPATGDKRKCADGADDGDGSPAGTKKAKLSPKSAGRVKIEEYLKIRVKDLGFNVDPVKGHDDDEDEDEPDEGWTSIQRLRQRCDDRLDEIEEAIRTVGRHLYSDHDIPEHKSDETRHEKRQKNKDIKDDEEVEPIAHPKRVKVRIEGGILHHDSCSFRISGLWQSFIYYMRKYADQPCDCRCPRTFPTAKDIDQRRSWGILRRSSSYSLERSWPRDEFRTPTT